MLQVVRLATARLWLQVVNLEVNLKFLSLVASLRISDPNSLAREVHRAADNYMVCMGRPSVLNRSGTLSRPGALGGSDSFGIRTEDVLRFVS